MRNNRRVAFSDDGLVEEEIVQVGKALFKDRVRPRLPETIPGIVQIEIILAAVLDGERLLRSHPERKVGRAVSDLARC